MIFVTVTAVGALVGLLVQVGPRAVSAPSRTHRGAAGAFLAGALVVGLAERQVGPADPLALAAAVAGALAFLFLLTWVEKRPAGIATYADRRRDKPFRVSMRTHKSGVIAALKRY